MTRASLICLSIAALVSSCTNPAPPASNSPPAAALTANATGQAGVALAFTSTSSDPDGDALTLSWDFGDGLRGGGTSIAHVYTKAGAYSLKLTANDGKGGVSSAAKTVTVSASSVIAGPTLSVIGTITDATGTALSGVTVQRDGASLGSSDALGKVTVSVPTGVPINLVLTKIGYAHGFAALEFPLGSNASNADFRATLLARGAVQALDAGAGGAITGADNARVELPANALETMNGTPVTGAVSISLSPVDVNDPLEKSAFPGSFEGIEASGSSTGIVSLGTTEFSLEQNGQRLNLKAGSSAKVRLPMYANANLDGSPINLGDTIALWSLNEQTGDWVQEGTGVVVDSSAGTRALEAVVTHFSWWNVDQRFISSNPKPKCINDVPGQYDSIFEQANFCKFLAEIDKPIPPQGSRLRLQADPPRLPAYAATTDLAMTGGQSLLVPAGTNIRYTGCIANGAFCGSIVKNFAAGASEPFEIRLKRGVSENITLPFDATRVITAPQTLQFAGVASPNGVSITVERSPNSSLNATVALLDSSGIERATGNLGSSAVSLEVKLIAGVQYSLTINPSLSSSGSVRIRVERSTVSTDPLVWAKLFQGTSPTVIADRRELQMNAAGYGAAIWLRQVTGLAPNLYYPSVNSYDPQTDSWSVRQTLDTLDAVTGNARPDVTVGIAANNDSIALWTDPRANSLGRLRWSRQVAGVWSAAATLDTALVQKYPVTPQIRLAANGNAIATWLEYGGLAGNRLRLARFNAATASWGAVQTMPSGTGVEAAYLSGDIAGNATLFYYDAGSYYVQRYTAATDAWSAATQLLTGGSGSGYINQQLELNSSGNGLAMHWANDIQVRGYDLASNTWKPVQVFAGRHARIGLISSGNATMTYIDTDGSSLLTRRYTASSDTWSAAETIATSVATDYELALNASGDAVVVFRSSSNQNTFLTARVTSAATWTVPVQYGTNDLRRIALGETGQATVLRILYLGTTSELQAKRFNIR